MNKKLQEYQEHGNKAFASDEEWLATQSTRTTGRRVVKIIFVAIIVVAALFIIAAVATSMLTRQNSSSTAADVVSELRSDSSFTLPQKVDEVTDLTDVTSSGNTIQYHYILHDADTSSLSDEALRSNIQPKICSSDSMRNLLSHGVDVEYLYTVQDTTEQYSFSVTKNDC